MLAAAGLGADYWESPGCVVLGVAGEVIDLSQVRWRLTDCGYPADAGGADRARDSDDSDRASDAEGAVGSDGAGVESSAGRSNSAAVEAGAVCSLGEDCTGAEVDSDVTPGGAEGVADDVVDGAAATECTGMPLSGPAAGWVRAEWLRAPLRPEVRALMTLPPGLELLAALQQVGTEPVCPMDHNLQGLGVAEDDDTDSGADADENADAGRVRLCQCLAGRRGAVWVSVGLAGGVGGDGGMGGDAGADALVAAAGRQPVKAIPERMVRATVTDPGRNEVAAVLALSPASTDTRLKAARRLNTHPQLADLARDGVLFTPGVRVILEETANLSPAAQSAVIARACERVRARCTGAGARGRRASCVWR